MPELLQSSTCGHSWLQIWGHGSAVENLKRLCGREFWISATHSVLVVFRLIRENCTTRTRQNTTTELTELHGRERMRKFERSEESASVFSVCSVVKSPRIPIRTMAGPEERNYETRERRENRNTEELPNPFSCVLRLS